MRDIIKAIASDIKTSKHVVIFTGAGISVESGIPAYRGEKGLWNKYDPNIYANITYFLQDPSYYWNFFREVRYPMLKKVKPNKAHLALAELETVGNLKTVITQNIDGLHQDAGSSSVIELHGTTRTIYCLNCSQEYSMDEVFSMLEAQIPPLCSECKGKLRPAVVFFGESLNSQILRLAFEEAENCDFLLAVGSSLVVHPAADIPRMAKQRGAFLAIINIEKTPLDTTADYVINDEAGKILPQIVQSLKDD
ncbi:MAG: NAD-dependent protein deacylase [Candidatus Aminicenantes bacterium]|jgi:NAD-dependent deacetylase|nr:MAG: NAD-dependent protein deacylase [Candidatus Aminicenantes bacterium]